MDSFSAAWRWAVVLPWKVSDMSSLYKSVTSLALLLVLTLCGCSYFGGAAADDDDAEMSELDEEKSGTVAEAHDQFSMESLPEEREIELKLNPGDRFPLMKSVETRLTQIDRTGASLNVSTSRIQMLLSLVVDEVSADGQKKLTARYHRVQFEQDLDGRQVAYSSELPGEPVPPEAMMYAGLPNNGFSFVLGRDNKIVELIGFNEFLQRCLRNVPSQYAAAVQQQLAATKSEDGISNFVDEGIGLLPYSTDPARSAVAVKEGTTWELPPRRIDQPIPMLVTTKCMLKALTRNSAEITLSGEITGPGRVVPVRGEEGEVSVFVRGGHCTGACQVDRVTGLPTRSHVMRYLEMVVRTADGQEIQQVKETVSKIESFLDQSPRPPRDIERPAAPDESSAVNQAVFHIQRGAENQRSSGVSGSRPRF